MSFRAIWDVFPADPAGRTTGENVVVDTPDGVAELVERLTDPQASTAKIWGPDIRQDGWTGQLIHAAVDGQFGYLSYNSDECALVFPAGNPASPGYDSMDEEFPAGSGILVAELAAALREFLATGSQPRAVRWAAAATFGE
jgi:hypothetical protein